MNNDVPIQIRDVLLEKISLTKERIDVLASKFSLEKRMDSVSRQIFGKLSVIWISRDEIKSKRLRGYGEVAKGLKNELDPELDVIIDLLREMLSLLRSK